MPFPLYPALLLRPVRGAVIGGASPTPVRGGQCEVTGDFINEDGTFPEGVEFTFRLVAPYPAKSGDYIIVNREVTAVIDELGHLSVWLDRNDEITPLGTQWIVICDAMKIKPNTRVTLNSGAFDIGTLVRLP